MLLLNYSPEEFLKQLTVELNLGKYLKSLSVKELISILIFLDII